MDILIIIGLILLTFLVWQRYFKINPLKENALSPALSCVNSFPAQAPANFKSFNPIKSYSSQKP